MTGSGKTGLCIGLLEEAAIDGVPSIVIDPKGDLADLLLTFPELRPEDFRPWISEEEAAKKGLSPDDFAQQQAEMWKKGLADWGQDPARIQRLKDAADFTIYTPGSNAGLPVSILKSFAAPAPAVRADDEALRDRINTAATSILGLVGVTADPIQSREHILLSSLFNTAWSAGQDLDLAGLIQQIQTPPFTQVGVLDLESFYPAKDRFALAMLLNNLLAAPTFQTWLEGEALDIGQMLFTERGQAPGVDLLHRPPLRRRAHVLRLAAPERGAGLGAGAAGHGQPAGHHLHGRDLRLLPAGGRTALEAAAADPAQAGPGLRGGRPAGHPEPGGPRLQGPGQRRHLVHRPSADRARQGPPARGTGGRGRGHRGQVRPAGDGGDPGRPGQAGVPHVQRARGRPGDLPDPLDHVLPGRPADPDPDQDPHGPAPAGRGRPEPAAAATGCAVSAPAPATGAAAPRRRPRRRAAAAAGDRPSRRPLSRRRSRSTTCRFAARPRPAPTWSTRPESWRRPRSAS